MSLRNSAQQAQLERILRDYGAKLRALVRQHCSPEQGLDPDDIEQEVRIKLWKALEGEKNLDFPASYIQRIVVTTVIDALRRADARPEEPMPETGAEAQFELVMRADRPDTSAAGSEMVEIVARCVAELPERRRKPVQLALQGFSPEEIGDLLGLTGTAARNLMYRGLDELKSRLRELGMGEFDV